MMVLKLQRVSFDVHLERQSCLSKQRKERQMFKISVLHVPQTYVGSYSASVIVGGKIWKGAIAEYVWKEQNMFASNRKWKALFGSSFFSALIGLYIQIFLFQHLNWIDKDNLQFFHFCKKKGSFHGSHPPQISGEWASFVQLRCPNHSCLPTQQLASFWPYKGHCPQYVIAFLYSSVPCLCIHEDTEEILEILMGKVFSCPY